MKLTPEQIYYLRKRRRELKEKISEFSEYCESRNKLDIDSLYKEAQNLKDQEEINKMLKESEFVKERNFEMIDIGTIFTAEFGDGYKTPVMLIDQDTLYDPTGSYTTLDSDFGSVVKGAKAGDKITYIAESTGKKIKVKIDEIDKVRDHYMHFIKERTYKNRVCAQVKRQMARLKISSDEEYRNALAITESQVELLYDELEKLDYKKQEDKSRINEIKKIIKEYPIAPKPKGEIVQPGSRIVITFISKNNEFETKEYEFINRAISTELDSEYIERISDLGNRIYGLIPGDGFFLPDNNKYLGGVIESINNEEEIKRVR